MSEHTEEIRCLRCGEVMEAGYATAIGLIGGHVASADARLVFVVPGQATSRNLIEAFQQGLREERANEAYLLQGFRCPNCGTVELVAKERTPWEP